MFCNNYSQWEQYCLFSHGGVSQVYDVFLLQLGAKEGPFKYQEAVADELQTARTYSKGKDTVLFDTLSPHTEVQ